MTITNELIARRQQLLSTLGDGALAIVTAGSETIRNGDNIYPFRQDSNFYYLTGCEQPEAILVLNHNDEAHPVRLFMRPYSEKRALWDGDTMKPEDAATQYGVDIGQPLDELSAYLKVALKKAAMVYCDNAAQALLEANDFQSEYKDVAPFIHQQRLVKSEHELTLMQEAADITADSLVACLAGGITVSNELEFEAEMRYQMMRRGAKHVAYNPIVAGGANACTLHYNDNDQPLNQNDLLLVDIGAEFGHYASDITRTFPVSGQFSEPQAKIYQAVLDAQLAAIAKVKPGNTWEDVHLAALEQLFAACQALGILSEGDKEHLTRYYPHKTGHWLGLDVHDVGVYQDGDEPRQFEPGMVLTIEPGLYIPLNDESVDPQWRGIGVRIEDDVAVTDSGHRVLSQRAPKTINDIEALMHGS